MEYLIENNLWVETPHLPVIREVGTLDVPEELERNADLLYMREDLPFFYIREYLEPQNQLVSAGEISEEEADAHLDKLEVAMDRLGIRLNDWAPDNVGYRPHDHHTLVLLDVDCS